MKAAYSFGQCGFVCPVTLDVTSGLQGMVDRHLTELQTKLLAARSARVAQIERRPRSGNGRITSVEH